jgi:hypothetical protein
MIEYYFWCLVGSLTVIFLGGLWRNLDEYDSFWYFGGLLIQGGGCVYAIYSGFWFFHILWSKIDLITVTP